MGLFSFIGFGQDSKKQNKDISSKSDSSRKINQQQLKLVDLSSVQPYATFKNN